MLFLIFIPGFSSFLQRFQPHLAKSDYNVRALLFFFFFPLSLKILALIKTVFPIKLSKHHHPELDPYHRMESCKLFSEFAEFIWLKHMNEVQEGMMELSTGQPSARVETSYYLLFKLFPILFLLSWLSSYINLLAISNFSSLSLQSISTLK